MSAMEGPFYPLEEALTKLNISRAELVHLIQTDQIEAVVFTKSRNFLLFHHEEDGWVGHATCEYRGHIAMHKSYIVTLLDGDQLTMGEGSVELLEAPGITRWSRDYPFKHPVPYEPIIEWDPFEELSLETAATPLPIEGRNIVSALTDAAYKAVVVRAQLYPDDKQAQEALQNYPGPEADGESLFFSENSRFDPGDLRIPASEILGFQQLATDSLKDPTNRQRVHDSEGGRENQFHTLIENLIIENPKISAIQTWKLLEKDHAQKVRTYDKKRIIKFIEVDRLAWVSRHGYEQLFMWTSFPPLLSKLRRKLQL